MVINYSVYSFVVLIYPLNSPSFPASPFFNPTFTKQRGAGIGVLMCTDLPYALGHHSGRDRRGFRVRRVWLHCCCDVSSWSVSHVWLCWCFCLKTLSSCCCLLIPEILWSSSNICSETPRLWDSTIDVYTADFSDRVRTAQQTQQLLFILTPFLFLLLIVCFFTFTLVSRVCHY